MVGSGDYNIFSVAVFNSWFIIEAVEIWKIRKNTVFCSDRIICFRKHRFWIYCIYTDIRKRMYELIPFWSWRKVIFEHDFMLLEENLLNMLLFVPIGGLLELCLKRIKWKQAASIGLGISVVIELSQLILCRGWFEWDDMIHNTLGCVCGYLIVKKLYVLKRKMADY